jgi:hypothetical protein
MKIVFEGLLPEAPVAVETVNVEAARQRRQRRRARVRLAPISAETRLFHAL